MQQDRKAIRSHIRALRRALTPAEHRHRALSLARVLATKSQFLNSRRLAFYWPSDGELDPGPLMALALAADKRCYLPVLHPLGSGRLHFVEYQTGLSLRANRYGIPEPSLRGARPVSLGALDIIFLPLVAFDRQGNRLGMGAGYYDRTLASLRHRPGRKPFLVGIGHSFQEVDGLAPAPWDVPLRGIATEKEFILL